MEFINFNECDIANKYEQIKEIFFLTSHTKEFANKDQKRKHYDNYLGDYLEKHNCIVAIKNKKILGYIIAKERTLNSNDFSYYKYFQEHLTRFPAHLHINMHPKAQGLGIGGKLLEKLCEQMRTRGVKGIHIITGAQSRNKNFYSKHQFNFEHTADRVHFMGRELSYNSSHN